MVLTRVTGSTLLHPECLDEWQCISSSMLFLLSRFDLYPIFYALKTVLLRNASYFTIIRSPVRLSTVFRHPDHCDMAEPYVTE